MSGLKENQQLRIVNQTSYPYIENNIKNGINFIDVKNYNNPDSQYPAIYITYVVANNNGNKTLNNVTVEIFPLYPDQLVFNNTKAQTVKPVKINTTRGFTVIVRRQFIQEDIVTAVLGQQGNTNRGSDYYIRDYKAAANLGWRAFNFGAGNEGYLPNPLGNLMWSTLSKFFNGQVSTINKPALESSDDAPLMIGSFSNKYDGYGNFAVREVYIFDRDLAQSQIEKFISDNMIPLPEVYYDVEKQGTLNEHVTKDKLIDFSGNQHHGTLHNFTFDESNGWGYYADTNYKLEINNSQSEKLSEHKYRLNCPETETSGCVCLLGQKIEGAFTNLKLPKFKVKVTTDSETTVGTLGLYIDGVRNYDYYYSIGNGENIIEYAPITCNESFQLAVTHGGNTIPYDIEFLLTDEDCLRFDASKRTNVTIPNLKGFKTVFLDVDKGEEINTLLYDQRTAHSIIPLAIFNQSDSIAYAARNNGGLNYINGVLNTTIKCNNLTTRHLITLVNDINIEIGAENPTFGKGNKDQNQVYDSSMKFYKFLGFKEVLSPEQIQKVIERYNLYTE